MRTIRCNGRRVTAAAAFLAAVVVGTQAMGSAVQISATAINANYADHVNLTTDIASGSSGNDVPAPVGPVVDWVKWANMTTWTGGTYNDGMLDAANGGAYKSGGTGQISRVLTKVEVGGSSPARQNNGLFFVTYTDGNVAAPVDPNDKGSVAVKLDYDPDAGGPTPKLNLDGSGLQFVVSGLAANLPYRLHLLAGGRHSTRTLTATLTDSTTDSDEILNNTGSWDGSNYLIAFTPTSAGQSLTVSLTGVQDTGGSVWGDVNITAAVLSVPEPTTLGLLGTAALLVLRRRS